MSTQVNSLIDEMKERYDEYLSEENVNADEFLIHVLAAKLIEYQNQNQYLEKVVAGLTRCEVLNR